MTESELLGELVDLIGEVVDLGPAPVGRETRFGSDIPVSSAEMLRIVSRVKGRFAVEFGPAEVLGLRNIGDLVGLVHRSKAMRA